MGEVAAEVEGHGAKVYTKVQDSPEELPRDFARDARMVHNSFIPDFKPNWPVIVGTTFIVTLACLWYVLYFTFFYQHDRRLETREDKDRTKKEAMEQQATILGGHFDKARCTPDCRPDMVVVFHKPNCPKYESDKDTDISAAKVGQIFRTDTSKLKFHHFDKQVEEDETPEQLNLLEVRGSLLKDLHAVARDMGFRAEVFSSIDQDEVFLCISLTDDEYIKDFIINSHMDLQLKQEVVDRLGIGSCSDSSATQPPFLRYDPWAVSQLHKQGVIDEDDPRQMFETYKARDPKGCLLSSLERFRVIYRRLSEGFDLDTAKSQGIIVDWYPAHSRNRLRRLGLIWGSLRWVTDFTFKQPINEINNYFGTRVSFLFAWNGLYCKALLGLIPPAILWSSVGLIARHGFGMDADEASRQVLGMTIIVLVWAKIAGNLWNQEQDFFLKVWGLNSDVKDRIIRAEYRGELEPATHDSNLREMHASRVSVTLRSLISGLCTLLYILAVVFALMLWLSVFDGNMNLVAAICLTIKIKIFEFVWNILCPILTEFENLKYADDYYNSFMLKQFSFSFVNNYWAFFFLAIKQKYTATGCPAGGCLWAVRKQLTITLAILSFCRILQVVLDCFLVKFWLWWEDRALKKQLGTEEIPKRSFVEEQSKYSDFSVAEHVQNTIQLVVPLGYVMLFGGIAPFIVPMCFAVFAISLRAGAFTLITSLKRPVPRMMYGMGRWGEVVTGLMYIGLVFSGFLLAAYGDMLDGTWMITRVSIVGVFVLIVVLMWTVVDCLIPSSCKTVEIMAARRIRINHMIEEELAKATGAAVREKGAKNPFTSSDKALQEGQWDNIRASADTQEEDLS